MPTVCSKIDASNFPAGSLDVRYLCSLCTYNQISGKRVKVTHNHTSSRELRKIKTEGDRQRVYDCGECITPHISLFKEQDGYLWLLLGDSTMKGSHQPREEGLVCPKNRRHLDREEVSGARIRGLTEVFNIRYGKCKTPLRVIVMGGLNDLIKDHSFEEIIKDFDELIEAINMNNSFHEDTPNRIFLSTLPCPPQLHRPVIPGREEEARDIPADYVSKLPDMILLNDWIMNSNTGRGEKTLLLHTYGWRDSLKWLDGGVLYNCRSIQWSSWRKEVPRHYTVHFSDKMRCKISSKIQDFIMKCEAEDRRREALSEPSERVVTVEEPAPTPEENEDVEELVLVDQVGTVDEDVATMILEECEEEMAEERARKVELIQRVFSSQ